MLCFKITVRAWLTPLLLLTASAAAQQPAPAPFFERDGHWMTIRRGFTTEVTRAGLSHLVRNGSAALRLDWEIEGLEFDRVEGTGATSAKVNLFIGEPTSWRNNLPAFSGVSAQSPEVELRVEAGAELRWSLLLAPGLSPSSLRFRYRGADELVVDGDGSLIVKTALGVLVERSVQVFQVQTNGTRVKRSARFVAHGDTYEVQTDELDRTLATVIDPPVDWARYIGGSAADAWGDVAADSAGNCYVVGYGGSTDLPTMAAYDATQNGQFDVFVAKLSGTSLQWLTYLGGSQYDYATGVAVSSTGNVAVAGYTGSNQFPTTAGAHQPASNQGTEGFVTLFSPTGNSLVWSTYMGGNNEDLIYDVAFEPNDDVVIHGQTKSNNFWLLNGIDTTLGGTDDSFVSRFSAAGVLLWSTLLGGSGGEIGLAIATDPQGDIYVTGQTNSADFPRVAGLGYGYTFYETYVTKYRGDGGIAWSSLLGGANYDQGNDIASGPSGVTVVGSTQSLDFPITASALQSAHAGGTTDGFISRISSDGSQLLYSTYFGADGGGSLVGVAEAPGGRAVVAGRTDAALFGFQGALLGSNDVCVAMIDIQGTTSSVVWGAYVGGASSDTPGGLAFAADTAYVMGDTLSATLTAADGGYVASNDIFLWVRSNSSSPLDGGASSADAGADAGSTDAGSTSDGGVGPDAGAGTDAGPSTDAGGAPSSDGGQDASRERLHLPVGCGCGAADFAPVALLLGVVIRRPRARR